MKVDKSKAIAMALEAIVEAVGAAPDGAPGGILYAALMTHGVSYSLFELMMETLVREGKLTKRGQLYFVNRADRFTYKEGDLIKIG